MASPPSGELLALLEASLNRAPAAVAVSHGSTLLTFRELKLNAAAAARALVATGIGPGSVVAVLGPRSIAVIVGILGVLKAGAAFWLLDPSLPQQRLNRLIKLVQPSAVIVARDPEGTAKLLHIPAYDVIGDRWSMNIKTFESPSSCSKVISELPTGTAYIVFTSGSTGVPKACLGTDAGLANRLRWTAKYYSSANTLAMEPGDLVIAHTALSFVDAITELLGPIAASARVHLLSDDVASDPRQLALAVVQLGASRLSSTPAILGLILDAFEALNLCASVRLKIVSVSGEPLHRRMADRFHAMLSPCRLVNLYGTSEVAGDVAWHDATKPCTGEVVPIGCAIPGVNLEVLSAELEPVEDGDVGELCVCGACVGPGYYGITDRRAPAFSRPGLFRTGDLGFRGTSGSINWVGRRDRQIQVNGQRVEPDELEATIVTETVATACCAVAVPMTTTRSSRIKLAVAVQPARVCKQNVIQTCYRLLPRFMVPSHVVVLAALPLNPSGKVDIKKVASICEATMQIERETHEGTATQPSVNKFEQIIQSEAAVLGINIATVTQDFVTAGGDSVVGVDLASRLCRIISGARHGDLVGLLLSRTPIKMIALYLDKIKSVNSATLGTGQISGHHSKRLRTYQCTEDTNFVDDMSRHNVKITVARRGEPVLSVGPRPTSMQIKWSSSSLGKCIDASALVAPPRVYIGSHSHQFVALDYDCGQVLWNIELPDRIESSAVLASSGVRVVVGCYDGFLYCLACKNGAQLWKYFCGGEVKSSPTVDIHSGIVIVGSHGGGFHGVDETTGLMQWHYAPPSGGSIYASPALHQGYCVCASLAGCVFAVCAKNGTERWATLTDAPIFASPAMCDDGGVILGSAKGQVFCFTCNGAIDWIISLPGSIYGAATIVESANLALIGAHDCCVYGLARHNGELIWQVALHAPIFASVAIVRAGVAMACSSDGTAHLIQIDQTTGNEERHKEEVVAQQCNGNLHTESTLTPFRRPLALLKLPGQVFSSPVVWKHQVFIGCRDNKMHCLSLSTL